MGQKIVSVCFYPWSALSVLCDGRAVTCCMDYNGVQGVGDLNFQSVMEIWNGPVLSAIRRNFGKLDDSGLLAELPGRVSKKFGGLSLELVQ